MKILITNDDGIDAPGLSVLYDLALGLTDAKNIHTVAPAVEQSGVGHAITYLGAVTLEKREPRKWVIHGTPADCIIVGIYEGSKPDLVLSGVNRGNNAGQNTFYSGTVLDRDLWLNNATRIHYNVNFPPCLAADVQGTQFTTQGFRPGAPFTTKHIDGQLFVKGTPQQQQDTGIGTDVHANMMDQIAITPCTTDLTDQTILQRLRLP